ncbi:MAG: VPLPA-CTERM sorting domain-containing protein [Octadecabacter sp.]|nr:VPLPA-CTERM sorting domain-containing protein [Octadecabacter sp.]
MKYVLSALLFLAATGAQASTLKLGFDVTVTRNACAGSTEYFDCTLTFDGLEVGKTYKGEITLSRMVTPLDRYFFTDAGPLVDLSQSFSESYVFVDWSCHIGGIACYSNRPREQIARASFDYTTGEGEFTFYDNNKNESFRLGGKTELVDDQGLVWQSFAATTTAAKNLPQVQVVPLPASGMMLLAGLAALAWRRKRS